MGIVELVLVSIGLAMDAFAVAICKGLGMKKLNLKHCSIIALFFGVFQAAMPLLGWFLGKQFAGYIASFDHWVAFLLLCFIGIKMVMDALKKDDEQETQCTDTLDLKELTILAIATSIDALAVGITLALLPGTNIWLSISVIGLITFVLSFGGVVIGNKFGSKYEKKAELAGGIILILMGCKILLEHLGIF